MNSKTLVILLPLFLSAVPAAAQSNSTVAEQLYRDANSLRDQGKIHEACLKFGASQKLDPQLGTLLNLASCHEKDGKTATAWTEYSELVDRAGEKRDTKRAAYAKRKVEELGRTLPRLQLEVPAGTGELKLDGMILASEGWTSLLPIDPGDHEITYSAPGKKPGAQHVTAAAGATAKVTLAPLLDVEPLVMPVAPIPTPVLPEARGAGRTDEPASTSGSGVRTTGIFVGAAGVVGLGVGAVFGALALGSKSDVNRECNGNQCAQSGLDAVSSARTQGTVSTVGFIAGGACLAAGVTMILLGKKSSTVGLAPMTETRGAGLSLFGAF